MKAVHRFSVALTFLAVTLLLSCTKNPEEQLQGKWDYNPDYVGQDTKMWLATEEIPEEQFFAEKEDLTRFTLIFNEGHRVTVITKSKQRDCDFTLSADGKKLVIKERDVTSPKMQEFEVFSLAAQKMILKWTTVTLMNDPTGKEPGKKIHFKSETSFVREKAK